MDSSRQAQGLLAYLERHGCETALVASRRRILFVHSAARCGPLTNPQTARPLLEDEVSFIEDTIGTAVADSYILRVDTTTGRLQPLDGSALAPAVIAQLNGSPQLRAIGIRVTDAGQMHSTIEGTDELDRELGIDTAGVAFNLNTSGSRPVHYAAMPYEAIDVLLGALAMNHEDVFVDLGCGKGRVLCRAAQWPIRRAIGVECEPALAACCARNLATMRGRRADTQVLCGRIEEVGIDDGTVYLTYGPFPADVLAAALAAIERSLRNRPRCARWIVAGADPTTLASLLEHSSMVKRVEWQQAIVIHLAG